MGTSVTTMRNYAALVSRLSARQLFHRAVSTLKYSAWQNGWFRPGLRAVQPVKMVADNHYLHDPGRWSAHFDVAANNAQTVVSQARALVTDGISLLNQPVFSLQPPVNWLGEQGAEKLWVYTLHYFGFGVTLAEAYVFSRSDEYLIAVLDLIADWRTQNRPGCGPGWERYPVARRLLNFLEISCILQGAGVSVERLSPVLIGAAEHAEFLYRNLEFDVGYNHLLANAKALIVAGSVLACDRSARWFQRGLSVLKREAAVQFLPDGGHAERSTTYHLHATVDLIDCMLVLRKVGKVPEVVADAASRAASFLMGMSRADGSLPLFNDAWEDSIASASVVNAAAIVLGNPNLVTSHTPDSFLLKRLEEHEVQKLNTCMMVPGRKMGCVLYPVTGYGVLRGKTQPLHVLFDAGPMGPPEQMGHGHADALHFELAIGSTPLVTDSGTYTYQGALRNIFRSTAAHNTVVIDGQDQCEFFGTFRVGGVAHARTTDYRVLGLSASVAGEHTGYLRLGSPVRHRRRVTIREPRFIRVVDELFTDGKHEADMYFHLSVQAESVEQLPQTAVRVVYRDGTVVVFRFSGKGLRILVEEGWYSANFGCKATRPVLHLRAIISGTARFSTLITVLQSGPPKTL
jgi:uncharacterized heparinase superfamily protein